MTETEDEILAAIESGGIASALPKPLSGDDMDALVLRAKTDPGAPYETATVARIAATKRTDLPGFMRLRARLKEAGAKISELDKVVGKCDAAGGDAGRDQDHEGQGRAIAFPAVEPWPEPVDGAALIDELVAQIRRHVMLPLESAIAVALWIVCAHCFNAFTNSPRLVITSPEKRCGKTTLLGVVQALVPQPLAAASITAAAMFRTIEKYQPTLLIDEADTFLRDSEELRGIINSGHHRDGQVLRLVGDNHEPAAFSTFCPTAIAAIGKVPGTIEDRAFMIAMRRRLPGEKIERLRTDRVGHLTQLARRVARWVEDHAIELRAADPGTPDVLNDRAADNWRGALAVADIVGGDLPQRARAAACAISGHGSEDDGQSRGVTLLADIRRVFDYKLGDQDWDRISSTGLLSALVILPDRPWAAWSGGKQITTVAIARLLKGFNIVPNTIKLADGTQPNGYRLRQFKDAFARYLTPPVTSPSGGSPTSPTPANPGPAAQSEGSPDAHGGEVLNPAEVLENLEVGEDGEVAQWELIPRAADGDDCDVSANFFAQIMEGARRGAAVST